MKTLRIALIHLNIRHKEPDRNREELLALIRKAAHGGARIILAPEMVLSGYSFESRDDISPFVEARNGPTVSALSALASSLDVYICVGLALKEEGTGIFFNSAVTLDPEGQVVLQYNKINGEARWACPGDPMQDNTFTTPWGRVGVLICSDSYHSLMPRLTALRGADLLLIPANWPPSGLNPVELWGARAIENGFYVAGCNRTGRDLSMDCRASESCLYAPDGRLLFRGNSELSQIFQVELPLNASGCLENGHRRKRLAQRRPDEYHDIYLNLRQIRDLTALHGLPAPGRLEISCLTPQSPEHPADALSRLLASAAFPSKTLFLLPPFPYEEAAITAIEATAKQHGVDVLTRWIISERKSQIFFTAEDLTSPGYGVCPEFRYGPARIACPPFDGLAHPELFLAAAKRGSDLAVVLGENLSPETNLLAGARTIENLAVALCTPDGGGVWMYPEGHGRWEEVLAGPGELCRYTLDTSRTRQKRFQDSLDFTLLLNNASSEDDKTEDETIRGRYAFSCLLTH